jgi:formylglycine-generating enzyme required for sulfatase activity
MWRNQGAVYPYFALCLKSDVVPSFPEAVLLGTPQFLASVFIAKDGLPRLLPRLLNAAKEEGLTILWVAVSASLYTETEIAEYQAANNPVTPLDALSPSALNAKLVKIAQQIREVATRPIAVRPKGAGASGSAVDGSVYGNITVCLSAAPEPLRRASANATRQIFLCYARPDEDRVRELYQRLTAAGFKPWMDQEDIVPGERWRPSIERAIQRSDFFLACLSTHSVSRRGFLQREIKTAMDLWQEKLGSDIFLIPARFEPCEVPEDLTDFQWVNLYEERGWTRLLQALQVGLERRAELTESLGQETPPISVTATPQRPGDDIQRAMHQPRPTQTPTDERSEVVRQLERMRSTHLHARERVAAGNALAQQGDPRFSANAWFLLDEPLLGFVEIPAGPFLMGSDKAHDPGAYDDELPQHEVTLPRYFIGRYPVTVAQFLAFVEGGGSRPENPESVQGFANHPVVTVSWYEAQQYCDWLTERLRAWPGTPEPLAMLLRNEDWQVMLPSDVEWEKAARGTDRRIYPWGNEPDLNRANYDDTRVGNTSAVGCFPGGTSPYGVEDLSGNVWEWTRSLSEDYSYPQDQQERTWRENLPAGRGIPLVLRGGAFDDLHGGVRCACRLRYYPRDSDRNFGFRVVVRPCP